MRTYPMHLPWLRAEVSSKDLFYKSVRPRLKFEYTGMLSGRQFWARGGYSTKFYTGRLRPEVQTLTIYIPFLREKVPLSYTFRRKFYPFLIPAMRVLLNFSFEKALKILRLFSR